MAVRPGTVWTGIARHSPLLKFVFALAYPFLTSVEKVKKSLPGMAEARGGAILCVEAAGRWFPNVIFPLFSCGGRTGFRALEGRRVIRFGELSPRASPPLWTFAEYHTFRIKICSSM